MPFTFAHPAILFPLRWVNKKYISLTGLVIGSMAPDFEYFIWMSPNADISHSVKGILLFNLPITFLLAFVFHIVIKKTLLYHSPFINQRLLNPSFDFTAYFKRKWMVFTISALIGIVTHLVWDGFTHAHGHFVQTNSYLHQKVNMGAIEIRRCYIAWYLSSIIGLFIVIRYLLNLKKIFSKKTCSLLPKSFWHYWLSILLVAIVLAVVRIFWGLTWNWFRHIIIISIASLMYSLVIVSIMENRRITRNPIT